MNSSSYWCVFVFKHSSLFGIKGIPGKNSLNTVLGRNLFSIANDSSVNPSDLSKILVKKKMKYFDVPLEHAWKVPVLQELLNTRTNKLYVEGFDDYVLTEMIIMLCNE